MKVLLLALMLVAGTACLAGVASARPWWLRGTDSNESDFLPPDEAFRVSAHVDGGVIRIRWLIAGGYYLYRQRMDVRAESPDLILSPPKFPPGVAKTDPYLGTQEIFTRQVEGTAAFTRSDAAAHPLQIRVTYQGCAQAGLCYPPINKVLYPTAGAPAASLPRTSFWVRYSILGGALAFFLAGLSLRKGRRLALPA